MAQNLDKELLSPLSSLSAELPNSSGRVFRLSRRGHTLLGAALLLLPLLLTGSSGAGSQNPSPDEGLNPIVNAGSGDELPSAELNAIYGFDEPLEPIGRRTATHAQETEALADALRLYLEVGDLEAVAPLAGFLELYPDTAWRIPLLTNLGIIYR